MCLLYVYMYTTYLHTPTRRPRITTFFDPMYGEREGSRDIYPDEKGHYHLVSTPYYVYYVCIMCVLLCVLCVLLCI
jgi:hypothetical protein